MSEYPIFSDPDRLDSAAFLQNVFTGQHEGCGHDSSLETGDLAQTGIRMFLPGKEEFHPQASGSVVKAPAVQEKEQSQNEDNNQEDAEEKFESILPGRKWWRGEIGQQQKSYIF